MVRSHWVLFPIFVMAVMVGSARAQDITTGLIGYWKLDETSGTTATDSSGSGNDGTYTGGPTLGISAPRGFGAYFPSDGKYVIAPASATLNALGVSNADFSVAFWVKPNGLTGGWRALFHKGASDSERGPGLWLNQSTNRIHFRVTTASNWNEGTDSVTDLSNGIWSHIACVKAGNKWRCYVNGVLDTELTLSGDTIGNNGPLYFGDDPWYGGSNVYMDEVRIYSRALTPADIAGLNDLVGHWKFSEGTGSTAADSSGIANNATLLGGATWTTTCAGTNALLTDGTGAIAQTAAPFTPPSEGTVVFWMRGAGPRATIQRLCGVNGDWEIRQGTNGALMFDLGGSPYVGNEPFSTIDPVDTDGKWYHIAAVFSDVDNSYSVYINGALRTSGISPVDLVPQAAGILSFGTRTGSSEYWKGALRDFRIYNKRLTDSEIAVLYGLVGHWKLDETSGTTAADSSGCVNHGTYAGGPTLGVAAPHEFGAYFPSNDKYMTAPASASLNALGVNNADFTVAFWVKPNGLTGDWRPLFHKGAINFERGPGLWLNQDSNRVHFKVSTSSDNNQGTDSLADLLNGKWSHLACVKAGNKWRCYVNGVLNTEITLSSGTTGNNGPLYLGDDPWYNSGSNVSLDDVYIYNRALCETEIQDLKGTVNTGVRILKWVEIQ